MACIIFTNRISEVCKLMAIKNFSVRIDAEMLDKLHIVSTYEGRSANSQVLILIRDYIRQFEQTHGEITPELGLGGGMPGRATKT